jgi:hypothetical protein
MSLNLFLLMVLVAFVTEGQTTGNDYTAPTGDAAERFGQRDAEKFKFLGE